MSQPNLPPLSFTGREFSSSDLELIRQITSDFAGLGKITGQCGEWGIAVSNRKQYSVFVRD